MRRRFTLWTQAGRWYWAPSTNGRAHADCSRAFRSRDGAIRDAVKSLAALADAQGGN